VAYVLDRDDMELVVECGSGTSTVWLAYTLEQLGRGRIVALEHDEHFGGLTHDALARNGLAHRGEVRIAPLEDVLVGEEAYRWYAPATWQDLVEIDLLLVDGPPGHIGRDARYPAFPLLSPALAEEATVILDDVTREAEARIARRWQEEKHGVELVPVRDVDRSAVFRVRARDESAPQR
jgi:predicted O-methyltransferase YrrM